MEYSEIQTDLIINKLTTARYQQLSSNNQLNNNELYFITDTVDTKADKTYVDNIGLSYSSQTQKINLTRANGQVDSIDCTNFLKDNVLQNVRLENDNLIFTFNSNITPISVSLTSYIDDYASDIKTLSDELSVIKIDYLIEDDKAQIMSELGITENNLSTAIDNKILVGTLDSATAANDLSILKVTDDEYYSIVTSENGAPSNALYIVSSDITNVYGERIINVGLPLSADDAATKGYVDDIVGNIEILLQGI